MPIKMTITNDGYVLEMLQKDGRKVNRLARVDVKGQGPLLDRDTYKQAMDTLMESYPSVHRKRTVIQQYSANKKGD